MTSPTARANQRQRLIARTLPYDINADIAKAARALELLDGLSTGGKCLWRALVGYYALGLSGIRSGFRLGGLVYRVGPDENRDVLAFYFAPVHQRVARALLKEWHKSGQAKTPEDALMATPVRFCAQQRDRPMRHKPPSISRLRRYEKQIPMKDDPPSDANSVNSWEARQKAVYAAMMETKRNAENDPARSRVRKTPKYKT